MSGQFTVAVFVNSAWSSQAIGLVSRLRAINMLSRLSMAWLGQVTHVGDSFVLAASGRDYCDMRSAHVDVHISRTWRVVICSLCASRTFVLAAAAPFSEICLWTIMFMCLAFSRGCGLGASAPVGTCLVDYASACKVHVLVPWRALRWETTFPDQF